MNKNMEISFDGMNNNLINEFFSFREEELEKVDEEEKEYIKMHKLNRITDANIKEMIEILPEKITKADKVEIIKMLEEYRECMLDIFAYRNKKYYMVAYQDALKMIFGVFCKNEN